MTAPTCRTDAATKALVLKELTDAAEAFARYVSGDEDHAVLLIATDLHCRRVRQYLAQLLPAARAAEL